MKKFLMIILVVIMSITLTGCFNNDEMEDIDIYTSVYPIQYITEILYGEHSTISSIFPDGVDSISYNLTDKQLKDFSDSNLFIYDGLSNEKEYAVSMLNYNKKLKIIDTSLGMEYTNDVAELWLDPSNFLMMAQNIKSGLSEYITSNYLIKEIDEKYSKLQLDISEIDANIKDIVENANYTTIVVADDVFKYLEKYGLTVITLEENENLTQKNLDTVKELIKSGEVKYIYIRDDDEVNDTVKGILDDNSDVSTLSLNSLNTITSEERNNKENYITITNDNINQLKKELYK